MEDIKQKLFELCTAYVQQRIETANDAIKIAQASANEETKSSAGDKYETGRAMMQLEIEKNTVQLHEALKLKQLLDHMHPIKPATVAQAGALIVTDNGIYFISVSAGQLKHNDKVYFAIAPTSPIGLLLNGLKQGDSFVFNKKKISVISIH